jgi:hypothetical protein
VVLKVLPIKRYGLLRKEVKRRTRELKESYDDMKQYFDTVLAKLKENENMKGNYQNKKGKLSVEVLL